MSLLYSAGEWLDDTRTGEGTLDGAAGEFTGIWKADNPNSGQAEDFDLTGEGKYTGCVYKVGYCDAFCSVKCAILVQQPKPSC